MALTYTKISYGKSVRIETKYELKAYNNWGMFTTKGNKSLKLKAQALINKLENTNDTRKQVNALLSFLKSYKRMCNSNSYLEADDTDVRDCVFGFFEKACMSIGLKESAENLWYKVNI